MMVLTMLPAQALRGYKDVQPGDCIVAFSRRDIYAIKAEIERTTPHRVCVVYGALPPQMRRHQAQLFNNPVRSCVLMLCALALPASALVFLHFICTC